MRTRTSSQPSAVRFQLLVGQLDSLLPASPAATASVTAATTTALSPGFQSVYDLLLTKPVQCGLHIELQARLFLLIGPM